MASLHWSATVRLNQWRMKCVKSQFGPPVHLSRIQKGAAITQFPFLCLRRATTSVIVA